jgi:hypothetical protein
MKISIIGTGMVGQTLASGVLLMWMRVMGTLNTTAFNFRIVELKKH